MNENVENLVLEHLRHIRGRVDQIADDVGDLKQRMYGLESAMNLVHREADAMLKDNHAGHIQKTNP